MTNKSSFTPEEWNRIVGSPMVSAWRLQPRIQVAFGVC